MFHFDSEFKYETLSLSSSSAKLEKTRLESVGTALEVTAERTLCLWSTWLPS